VGLFTPRLVDKDVAEWQFEWFAWHIENFSSGAGLPDAELWLPVPQHFEVATDRKKLQGRDLAEYLFETVKRQCGYGPDTAITLEAVTERKHQSLGGLASIQVNGDSACGRYFFSKDSDGNVHEKITYDRDLESRPASLIATIAHELSHALHNRSRRRLDIEPELYELLTDLTAVYLGYGVFLANERFEFSQFHDADIQGWQAQGAGYLPEADLIFATALFMKIKGIDTGTAKSHLKPRLSKMLDKATKQLSGYEQEVAQLRELMPLTE